MAETPTGAHNVIAAFRDLELADRALRGLADAGVTADEVSVLGRDLGEVRLEDQDVTGEPVGGNVVTQSMTGGAVGGLAGGVLGLIGGAAAYAIPGVGALVGTGLLWSTLTGATAGGTVGFLAQGTQALSSDPQWEQTLQAIKDGSVVLGVHVDDPEDAARYRGVMEGFRPMWVDEFAGDSA